MKRRYFLEAGLSLAAGATLGVPHAGAAVVRRVRPGMPGWPTNAAWASLNKIVGGRLSRVILPDFKDPAVHKLLKYPFYIGNEPGLTQSSGWLGAWQSSPSAYVVAANSASHIAAAIRLPTPTISVSSSRAVAIAISAPPMHRILFSSGPGR